MNFGECCPLHDRRLSLYAKARRRETREYDPTEENAELQRCIYDTTTGITGITGITSEYRKVQSFCRQNSKKR